MVVNLMRVLRNGGWLPSDDGVDIMRAALSSTAPPAVARAEIEAEIERWERWPRRNRR
jgi:hypothetical protein